MILGEIYLSPAGCPIKLLAEVREGVGQFEYTDPANNYGYGVGTIAEFPLDAVRPMPSPVLSPVFMPGQRVMVTRVNSPFWQEMGEVAEVRLQKRGITTYYVMPDCEFVSYPYDADDLSAVTEIPDNAPPPPDHLYWTGVQDDDDDYDPSWDEPDYSEIYEPDYYEALDRAYANELPQEAYTAHLIEICTGALVKDQDWIPF